MAEMVTREAIGAILQDGSLDDGARADRLAALFGAALAEGYVEKGAAEASRAAAVQSAVERAREDLKREYRAPDPRESDEYRALRAEFDAYRARQGARLSPEYRAVKPKFFDAVYDRIDRGEGARPLAEQLAALRGEYEEFFLESERGRPAPPVVMPVGAAAEPRARITLTEAMRRANAGEQVDVGRIKGIGNRE